jgi:hypothetical protein
MFCRVVHAKYCKTRKCAIQPRFPTVRGTTCAPQAPAQQPGRRRFSAPAPMAYNAGMTEIALVLPFALPPPELAPDLAGHLKAPALAQLVSRSSSATLQREDAGMRHLPHERWLARMLGGAGEPAWTAAAMRGFGLDGGGGNWLTLHPAHIEIARSHLALNDLRHLGLAEPHARALFEAARPYFSESGLELAWGDAATWFVRADAWSGMETSSPDAAAGFDISFFLPHGPGAREFRKLQNELQMLWYEHPANLERQARGQRPVNAVWAWAGGCAAGAARPLHSADAPGWLAALARGTGGGPASALGGSETVVIDALSAAAIAGDWSAWIGEMERLEEEWFAPVLGLLRAGTAKRVSLHLGGRESLLAVATTAMSLRQFWRRPTLDKLHT